MTFIERVRTQLQDKAASIVTGALSALALLLIHAITPEVVPVLSSSRFQKAIVPLVAISLIGNLLLGLSVWSLTKKPRFRTRFGFYWDSKLQPHCPACESPMQWGEWAGTNGPGLLCGKCKSPRHLADDEGKKMPIAEARQILKDER